MAGIDPISSIGFNYNAFGYNTGNELTVDTKRKLLILGIYSSAIKTEAEGQRLLMSSQMKAVSTAKTALRSTDNALAEARTLAYDLGITYAYTDTLNDIIAKIKDKITQLKNEVKDNYDKKLQVLDYEDRLEYIEKSQLSHFGLVDSLYLNANSNIIYHNLY